MNTPKRTALLALLLPAGLLSSPAAALTTTLFTYQGQLKQGGIPADGIYDFEFSLWNDARSTDPRDQVGRTLSLADVAVENGLFTVQLDFGGDAFPGAPRYLEIAVRRSRGLTYTTLAPRQELTPTPYASTALSTVGVDGHSLDAADGSPVDVVVVDADGDVGVGTRTPRFTLDVAGTLNTTALRLATAPTDGYVLTSDASGNGTWRAPPAGGASVWGDGPEDHIYYNDGNVGIGTGSTQIPAQTLHVEGSAYIRDRVGIGVSAPGKPLDVRGDARVFNGNLHLGAQGFDPYIELMSDEDSDALEMRLKSLDGVGFVVTNSTDTALMVVKSTGPVGIGTTTPEHPLHVTSSTETAVFGVSNGSAKSGVYGKSINTSGRGVSGEGTGSHGYGLYGTAPSGIGVHGTSSTGTGVSGYVSDGAGEAVYGFNEGEIGDAIAVKGETASSTGYGGYFLGKGYFSGNVGIGVEPPLAKLHVQGNGGISPFRVEDEAGDPSPFAIRYDGNIGIGVEPSSLPLHFEREGYQFYLGYEHHTGLPFSSHEYRTMGVTYEDASFNWTGAYLSTFYDGSLGWSWTGVEGRAHGPGTNYAIYGTASGGSANYAGYFSGGDVKVNNNLNVDGTLTKGGGSFKIDHPLDPQNKYLQHSFVESPDMMNVYNGNVVLDRTGTAVVELPEYFQALNRDFRYQLTAIGAPGPNLYVAEKISRNRFKIAGGTPGMEVSWQVTGVRQDPWANANRIPIESDKPEALRGTYIHAPLYGAGAIAEAERIAPPRDVQRKGQAPVGR